METKLLQAPKAGDSFNGNFNGGNHTNISSCLVRGNIPKIAWGAAVETTAVETTWNNSPISSYFRLVNYYNLPRTMLVCPIFKQNYLYVSIFWVQKRPYRKKQEERITFVFWRGGPMSVVYIYDM
jgi:hypothetical protein